MLRTRLSILLIALAPWFAVDTARAEEGARASDAPSAPAVLKVPALVGKTRAQAEAQLDELGLRLKVEVVVEAALDPGLVVSQDPASGAEILAGATIELRVSAAPHDARPAPAPEADRPDVVVEVDPEPPVVERFIRMPSFRGMDRRDARDLAHELGLRFTAFRVRSHQAFGTVLAQSPRRDALVRPGSFVTVRYSDGAMRIDPGIGGGTGPGIPIDPTPSFASIPHLRGLERTVAETRLTNLGFRVRTTGPRIRPGGVTRTRVIRTNPAGGMTVPTGSQVEIVWEWVDELRPGPTPPPAPTPPAPGRVDPIPMPLDPGRVTRMMTTVPHVVGLTWNAAKIRLAAAGLEIDGTEPDRRLMSRTYVRTQSRPAGRMAFRGSKVRVGTVLRLGR